jgi:hypothetical protein
MGFPDLSYNFRKNDHLALFPEVKKKLVTVVEKTVDEDGKEVERTTVTEDSHWGDRGESFSVLLQTHYDELILCIYYHDIHII